MTRMTTRRRNVLVLVLVLVLGAVGAWVLAPSVRDRTAVEAIPSGAFLVITADLVKLRQSPLAAEVSGLREVSDVAELCGFDPLARTKTVAIGVPEKPDGVFGLAITHDLAENDLAHCAERVMGARSATPRITQRGSWTVVEQESILSEATRAKIAYRDGSPLLVARGDYLATMQAALDGAGKRAQDEAEHARLRKTAMEHANGNALVVATALLPKSLRDKLKDELSDEAESSETRKATMSAILSVNALAVSIAGRGDNLDVFAELDCETSAACAAVRELVERKRKTLADLPAARFVGIGSLLDALRLDAHGASLELSLSAPEADFSRAIRAVLASAFAPTRPIPVQADSGAGASGFSPR